MLTQLDKELRRNVRKLCNLNDCDWNKPTTPEAIRLYCANLRWQLGQEENDKLEQAREATTEYYLLKARWNLEQIGKFPSLNNVADWAISYFDGYQKHLEHLSLQLRYCTAAC